MSTSDPLSRLIAELARLPGIGRKTATRLAHHLLRVSTEDAQRLASTIVDVKELLFHCSICNSITDVDPCSICSDPQRDRTRICVVEEPFNIPPLERTREHEGLYHVLLGTLSPQRGIGPGDIAVEGLMKRLDGVEEVLLATNPDVEGEATALYIARLLRPHGNIKVTRLAFGMPVGGDIEFTDEVTLGRSIAGRLEL
ncbi:MAG: recombination mediator RecR [Acidobacteriota bacterium]